MLDRGTVRAFTRNGHDWSDRYPGNHLRRQAQLAILDGEVIVQDARGASDFEGLHTLLNTDRTR